MLTATNQLILDYLNRVAPFETAESYDNVGLLIGRADKPVKTVLVALDATMEVVNEAKKLGADTILTHHPLFFHAHRNLVEGTPEVDVICAMVRANISLISTHTNLDQSDMSGSACAARALGLTDIRKEGFLFVGNHEPMKAKALGNLIREKLHAPLRIYGDPEMMVSALAICSGAYGEGYTEAEALGVKAYLTGEIRHHEAIDAVMRGMVLFDGGHGATEQILVPGLAEGLQNELNALQCNVRVVPSTCVPYPGALE